MDKIELDNDSCKEVLLILAFCNKDIVNNIPDEIYRELVDKAALSEKEVKIDKNKKIDEQEISKDSIDYLTYLYVNYIATDKDKETINYLFDME